MVSRELIAASSKPVVLSVLARGESYGYAIIQKVRVLSAGTLEWSDGMLYPVLHRLEKAGLIRSRWGRSEAGRKRRYYRITARGRRALSAELADWERVHATLTNLQKEARCSC